MPKLRLHKPVCKYSLEEYLRKENRSVEKFELLNGNIVKRPFSNGTHNTIAINVATEITKLTDNLSVNCSVLSSNQNIYIPIYNDCVYADALAVCEKPLFWDDDDLLLINPILVVEVLSKNSGTPPAQKYDKNGKLDKYKTLESFKEYVMVRQNECYAEVWFRERPGLWHETIVTDLDGMLPLQSLGIDISMKRVYKNVSF